MSAVGVDGLNVVAASAQIGSALDLNAQETVAVVENEVIAFAVSPGLGDPETFSDSFVEEGGFGEFSGALGVLGSRFFRHFGHVLFQ